MRRSRPPSQVRMSHIWGEGEVRYVRWVKELRSGSGGVLSSASGGRVRAHIKRANNEHKRREKRHLVCRTAARRCTRSLCSGWGMKSWTRASRRWSTIVVVGLCPQCVVMSTTFPFRVNEGQVNHRTRQIHKQLNHYFLQPVSGFLRVLPQHPPKRRSTHVPRKIPLLVTFGCRAVLVSNKYPFGEETLPRHASRNAPFLTGNAPFPMRQPMKSPFLGKPCTDGNDISAP